jgi:hypothetical protein
MEKKGAVNQYVPHTRGELVAEGGVTVLRRPERSAISVFPPVFTVNLAAGTTPFISRFHGREYSSQCYRPTAPPVVTHGWYRPRLAEFDKLEDGSQEHVLNGGLLIAEVLDAAGRQLDADPVGHEWEYERFQAFCLETYGRRLGPLPKPRG